MKTETEHLLSSKKNKKRILESINQLKENQIDLDHEIKKAPKLIDA